MKKILALLLCCAMGLSLLCGCTTTEEVYIPTGDALVDEDALITEPTLAEEDDPSDQDLSLIYYPEETLNPLKSNDYTNKVLFSLLFQGLFITDRDYNVQPILCGRFTRADDLRSYTFYIDENARFSDGSPVTAEDVLASLEAAEDSKVYGARFNKVRNMFITESGGVCLALSTPMENLPILLDVPIMKANQLEYDTPVGTGPYKLSRTTTGLQLIKNDNWWCSAEMAVTAAVIPLVEAENNIQIRDEFQFGDLGLVQADPGSDRYADYRCDYEVWDVDNGIFLFMIVNKESELFSRPSLRTALSKSIDRESIVTEYYRDFAMPASLPCSPKSPYYNNKLAAKYDYEPGAFEKAVKEAGIVNWNVTIICNSEDTLRVRLANDLAEIFKSAGLLVTIETYSGNNLLYWLNNGEYDLYLGQTKLAPNRDLSPFFSTNCTLAYGGLSDMATFTLCQQSLENHGNFYTLHQHVMDNGYLCPILFRSYAVYATRGLLTNLTPARDWVFYYTIGKTMEDIYEWE